MHLDSSMLSTLFSTLPTNNQIRWLHPYLLTQLHDTKRILHTSYMQLMTYRPQTMKYWTFSKELKNFARILPYHLSSFDLIILKLQNFILWRSNILFILSLLYFIGTEDCSNFVTHVQLVHETLYLSLWNLFS